VLVKEMRSLGLDVELETVKEKLPAPAEGGAIR
jgi:hypothetical protein